MVTLWELDGQIAAVLNPGTLGEAFFQIHPGLVAKIPIAEMLDVAEVKLSKTRDDGTSGLIVWVNAGDETSKSVFRKRGYTRSSYHVEHMRRRWYSAPQPAFTPPNGYTMRALGDTVELPARSWLSWKVFHPDEPDQAYQGWEWYRNVQRIPIYRRDLDLVAVAPDRELAALGTVWLDDVTRTAVFEPMGTPPGLSKARARQSRDCRRSTPGREAGRNSGGSQFLWRCSQCPVRIAEFYRI